MIGTFASSHAPAGGVFSPLDLPWAHAYWTEGPEFVALGIADGGNVSTFPDEIGTDNLVAPASREPNLDADGLGTRPSLIAASGDRLHDTFSSTMTAPHSLVVIQRRNTNGALNQCVVDNGSGGSAAAFYYPNNNLRFDNGTLLAVTNPALAADALLVGYANGASSVVEVNGAVTSGSAGSNTRTGLTVFGLRSDNSTGYFVGAVSFVAVAPGDIRADPDWATFEAWVTSHYGITIA